MTTSLLKNTAQPQKRDMFIKNDNEGRDVLGDSRKHYRYPWVEIEKYGPRWEPIWDCRIRYRTLWEKIMQVIEQFQKIFSVLWFYGLSQKETV